MANRFTQINPQRYVESYVPLDYKMLSAFGDIYQKKSDDALSLISLAGLDLGNIKTLDRQDFKEGRDALVEAENKRLKELQAKAIEDPVGALPEIRQYALNLKQNLANGPLAMHNNLAAQQAAYVKDLYGNKKLPQAEKIQNLQRSLEKTDAYDLDNLKNISFTPNQYYEDPGITQRLLEYRKSMSPREWDNIGIRQDKDAAGNVLGYYDVKNNGKQLTEGEIISRLTPLLRSDTEAMNYLSYKADLNTNWNASDNMSYDTPYGSYADREAAIGNYIDNYVHQVSSAVGNATPVDVRGGGTQDYKESSRYNEGLKDRDLKGGTTFGAVDIATDMPKTVNMTSLNTATDELKGLEIALNTNLANAAPGSQEAALYQSQLRELKSRQENLYAIQEELNKQVDSKGTSYSKNLYKEFNNNQIYNKLTFTEFQDFLKKGRTAAIGKAGFTSDQLLQIFKKRDAYWNYIDNVKAGEFSVARNIKGFVGESPAVKSAQNYVFDAIDKDANLIFEGLTPKEDKALSDLKSKLGDYSKENSSVTIISNENTTTPKIYVKLADSKGNVLHSGFIRFNGDSQKEFFTSFALDVVDSEGKKKNTPQSSKNINDAYQMIGNVNFSDYTTGLDLSDTGQLTYSLESPLRIPVGDTGYLDVVSASSVSPSISGRPQENIGYYILKPDNTFYSEGSKPKLFGSRKEIEETLGVLYKMSYGQ